MYCIIIFKKADLFINFARKKIDLATTKKKIDLKKFGLAKI